MAHLYAIKYRRHDSPNRIWRMTVVARDADEAREYARIRDPQFGSTVTSPRRGKAVDEPEGADPLTAAKAEAFR
jgi:hypothetical protein